MILKLLRNLILPVNRVRVRNTFLKIFRNFLLKKTKINYIRVRKAKRQILSQQKFNIAALHSIKYFNIILYKWAVLIVPIGDIDILKVPIGTFYSDIL